MHDGLSGPERRELGALEDRIEEYIDGGRLVTEGKGTVEGDAAGLIRTRRLLRLVEGQALDLDGTWRPRFERYAELHRKADQRTLALCLGPLA
jgi:hypothetical protein